ncbi:MAG: transcriptional repressor [Candidatus Pelethousia sp.]|nr:transcriptional repressor [Candidatus Pelethousia sp.]
MIYSKQREFVLGAVRETQGQHPTADALYTAIREQSPSVSLATVYRNLNQLAEAGKIARISIPGAADRFDPVTDGHSHLICRDCGAVVDIPCTALPDLAGPVAAATGCLVESCGLVFCGLCPSCAAAQGS